MSKHILPEDAPIVAVSMCIKQLEAQNFHAVGEKYLTAVIDGAKCYPLSFPALGETLPAESLLNHVDGLLFTGSPSNVGVHHYAGPPDRPDSPQDPGRDDITLPLIRAAIARDVPILCICRGFQELNVALGGTLLTKVHEQQGRLDHRAKRGVPLDEMYGPAHGISFVPDSAFARIFGRNEAEVNSLHWQGIDRLAESLIVEGRASDGTIEAVRVAGTRFALGAQWHPEYRCADNPDSMRLFGAFGQAVRAYVKDGRRAYARVKSEAAQ
jgi:putative glutamine amidotransferase